MPRTAIIGAGSLGTVMGAIASKNGADVTLIDTNKEHVNALNEKGATITGKMSLTNVPIKAITPDKMEGIYDTVILLTKQTVNDIVLNNLLKYIDKNSVVCSLQNGIPDEIVEKIVGRERAAGGSVGWGAAYIKPGVAELYTDESAMIIEIGNLDNVVNEKLTRVESFLSLVGKVVINSNLTGFRWSKLLMNATFSGMSAALGCTFGHVLDDDKALTCAIEIGRELIQVARAKGINLEIIVPGKDFYTFESDMDTVKAFAIEVWSVHRPQKASMLQDMEKGIKCEIDYINGLVVKSGEETGVATPYNKKVVDIVKDFEVGGNFPNFDNLQKFYK